MGAAAAIVGLVGSAVSAYGSYSAGKAQKESADRQAFLDAKNAAFAASKQRLENEALLKRQRAAFAKAGVTMEGTPDVVIEESKLMQDIDAAAIRWSVNQQGIETRRQGQAAQTAGNISASGDLLSGISKFAGSVGSSSGSSASKSPTGTYTGANGKTYKKNVTGKVSAYEGW